MVHRASGSDENGRLSLLHNGRAVHRRSRFEAVAVKDRAIDEAGLFGEEYGTFALDPFRLGPRFRT